MANDHLPRIDASPMSLAVESAFGFALLLTDNLSESRTRASSPHLPLLMEAARTSLSQLFCLRNSSNQAIEGLYLASLTRRLESPNQAADFESESEAQRDRFRH
jgi:hypothetical protein